MKLARPDIFHPRIVLAGGPGDGGDSDDTGLVAALRQRGLHARRMSWDDPETLRADLVILRATGGYLDRLDEFLAWTRRVPNLLNAPGVIAWNVDGGYLRDLDRAGVPTVLGRDSGSAGQPASASDLVLVFLGGDQSHAFTTVPVRGPGRVGPDAERTPAKQLLPAEPDFELWDVGRAALRAAADQVGIRMGELLYARADVTGEPGDAKLVSLDLVAPLLGWRHLDSAARERGQRRFALCVESALERLGLGPLSHRRP